MPHNCNGSSTNLIIDVISKPMWYWDCRGSAAHNSSFPKKAMCIASYIKTGAAIHQSSSLQRIVGTMKRKQQWASCNWSAHSQPVQWPTPPSFIIDVNTTLLVLLLESRSEPWYEWSHWSSCCAHGQMGINPGASCWRNKHHTKYLRYKSNLRYNQLPTTTLSISSQKIYSDSVTYNY